MILSSSGAENSAVPSTVKASSPLPTTDVTITPAASPIWMAGGGVKPGVSIGETDDYCYNIVSDPVHIHDLQATILHLMGIDHKKLTFKYQGRHFRLTDVHGNVVEQLLA